MKAIRHPDGRVEFDGTPEEIATAMGIVPAAAHASRPAQANGHAKPKIAPSRSSFRTRGTRLPGSLPARILDLLAEEPDRVFTPAEVAERLNIDAKAARGTLNRLARDEKPPAILYSGRGQYKAMPKEATQ